MLSGTVTEFDEQTGLGTVVGADGRQYLFHCIEIVDGSRTVDLGQPVRFQPLPKFGRIQAGRLVKL
jgi:cold shock CspA family protein